MGCHIAWSGVLKVYFRSAADEVASRAPVQPACVTTDIWLMLVMIKTSLCGLHLLMTRLCVYVLVPFI
jgi:hypothetical protein